jgi:thioredoxin-related protein
MSVRLFLFSVACIFALPLIGQNKIKWTSNEMMVEKIEKGNRKFIVYFYFDGCKWCRYMEETSFQNDNVAKFINQNYYSFRVNASSNEKLVLDNKVYTSVRIGKYDFHELAADLLAGDMSFPSIVFMDEKFKKIQAYSGHIDLHDFEMILSYYAGNHHKNTIWRRFANNFCKESHFNSLVNDKN